MFLRWWAGPVRREPDDTRVAVSGIRIIARAGSDRFTALPTYTGVDNPACFCG